ncbi:MAG: DNA polymerase I [Bacteroidales bacterium]|nr:DNA polymerase I [Bacteroidales bacterium]
MEKLFLVDAYALIFRAYYAFIKNPRINSKGLNTSAIFGFVNMLNDVLTKVNPTHVGVAFDPAGPTFRHEAYEAYKAQRESTPEDIRISVPIIKEIIKAFRIPILEVPGFEADDVIGTLSRKAGDLGYTVYMMTPDKDYGQLVSENVFIYRPKFGDKEYELLGAKEVCDKYAIQSPVQVIDLLGLMGDASDNIPGCPGVGEKTAQKLISEFGSIEQLLENTDKLKGALKIKVEENREKITFSKFLATIRLDVPIELKMDELIREAIDEPRLRELFEELEFRNLSDRLLTQSAPKQAKQQPVQGDLFAEIPTESEDDSKYSILRGYNQEVQNYQIADNEEEIGRLIAQLSSSDSWCFDTETTGVDPIVAQLVGMSFCITPNQAFYVPISADLKEAQKRVDLFRPLFQNSATKIGQNLKYDLLVLQNYGVEVCGALFDTMIAHYLLQPELRHGMDYLAEVYLKYQTIEIEALIGPRGKNQQSMRDVPLDKIAIYAAEDADVTMKLKEVLEPELKKNNLEHLFYEVEMPLVRVLASIESNGIRLDSSSLALSSQEMTSKMKQIEQEIYQLAGVEFNISSPKQVGEVLYDKLNIVEKAKKTKSGQYSTSEEVLESMRYKHPVVEKILEFRGFKKLLSTYIDSLPLLIQPSTGKIHTSFNQTVTSTGRLSSSNPNLQNIPIRDEDGKDIRKAFIPDDGCLFFSADYSQIELRIMAHLSKDANMIEAFHSGADIHTATAAKIYKVPLEAVDKEMRRKAKTANFGIIYGISVFGLSERLAISRAEAKELIEGYFANYPQVKEYMEKSIREAKEKGYVETLCHRKRFLPDINSGNAIVRGYAERNAINAPIQGSAADIIKIAMVHIYRRFKEEGLSSQMILQVHDELNFNVLISEKEQVERIVIEEMEHAIALLVPLKADCGWGTNWLEAH